MMAEWAARIIKQDPFTPPYMCLGFSHGGKMAAVVVVHEYRPPNCFVSIASVNPRFATRKNLRVIADWVFGQLKCTRMTGLVDRKNKRARRFDEGIGFRLEGVLRKALPGGGDLCVYGLLPEDFEAAMSRRKPRKKAA